MVTGQYYEWHPNRGSAEVAFVIEPIRCALLRKIPWHNSLARNMTGIKRRHVVQVILETSTHRRPVAGITTGLECMRGQVSNELGRS